MPEAVHPGSFVGDSIEEFKKLPTWGKIAAVGVVVIVIYLAIRARNAAATTNSSGMAGTTSTSGTQSPFPMVNGVPLLPPGTNPVFDSGGNLVGYQPGPALPIPYTPFQPAPPIPNPPLPPTQPPPSQAPGGGLVSQLPPGFQDVLGSIVTVNGSQYSIVPGSNGRIWAVQGTNYTNQQLLNAPIGTNPGQKILFYQGPAQNTQSAMNNPNHYTQNATPHLPTPSNNAPGSYLSIASTRPQGESYSPSATPTTTLTSTGAGGNRRLS